MRILSALLIAPLFFVVDTNAWGKDGHEMIANLAWNLLSNRTKTLIERILGHIDYNCTDYCSPLARVADWADRARYSKAYHWSAPLHYINIQDEAIAGGCPVMNTTLSSTLCHFDYYRDCANNVCVAGAIVNYTLQLQDHESSRTSLMFLTHFVGDIHQPLHVSRTSDRGGNDIHVTFDQDSTPFSFHLRNRMERRITYHRRNHHHVDNLHAVWDDGIIEKSILEEFQGSRSAMEQNLFQIIQKARNTGEWDHWLACPNGASRLCTSVWGEESLEYALAWAYRNVDGTEIVSGDKLTTAYHETRLPIVKERLAIAGVRLAVTLEISLIGTSDLLSNV